MSWLECPHCGKPTPIFGSGGGERLAKEVNLPLLGQIPLYAQVMEGGDHGLPIVVGDPQSSAARALTSIAVRVAAWAGAPAAT
jgi:ATP-binding protein involved in chromosome partitioning